VSFTFFTDRLGGYSQGDFSSLNLALHVDDDPVLVSKNREHIASEHGPTMYMNQVHGDAVHVITNSAQESPTCDALVTATPGITLAVLTADCIPLLLISQSAVAAVHVGRRGLVNGVARKAVQVMRELGATTITGKLGPSICGTCYEVDQKTFDEVVGLHPVARSATAKGTPSLDLSKALISDLESLSVVCTTDMRCTNEDPDLFSYRKSQRTGRQAGLIRL
jgi:YfiH family protein